MLREQIWLPPWADLRQPLEAVAQGRGVGVYVVGGVPRDILLERIPADFDLTVVGETSGFARALAGELDAAVEINKRFQTAEITLGDGRRIDVAASRSETYESPGALPRVRPADIQTDLQRRDFTINTLALGVAGEVHPGLLAAPGALEDLDSKLIRTLHPRSFEDDPIRILRAVRFEISHGMSMEEATWFEAQEALEQGHLAAVSGSRIWREMELLLNLGDHVSTALHRLEELGFLEALVPGLGWSASQAKTLSAARSVASILADHDPEASSVRVDRGLILLALAAGDDTVSEALILRLALPRSLRETLGGWKTAAHSQGRFCEPRWQRARSTPPCDRWTRRNSPGWRRSRATGGRPGSCLKSRLFVASSCVSVPPTCWGPERTLDPRSGALSEAPWRRVSMGVSGRSRSSTML